MMPPSKIKWYGLHIIYYLDFKLFMKTRCPSFPLKAEDISGKRTSIYPLLPRSSAAGWHPAAVPYEQESHQVQLHCQSCVHWFTGFVRSKNILTLSWQVGLCFRVGNCAGFDIDIFFLSFSLILLFEFAACIWCHFLTKLTVVSPSYRPHPAATGTMQEAPSWNLTLVLTSSITCMNSMRFSLMWPPGVTTLMPHGPHLQGIV